LPPLPSRAIIAVVPSAEPFQPHPLERALYADETKAAWSYDIKTAQGPESWGSLDKSFSTCSEAPNTQSPIDLFSFHMASPMSPLVTPQYGVGQMLIRNTGNYIRLIPHKGSSLYWGDKIFDLIYAQLHTPSEHRMSGEAFPLEIQFVHKAQDDDSFAVLSLLYKQGLENAFIEKILEVAPAETAKESFLTSAISLGDAIPRDITQYRSGTRISYPYYTYDGSMTTPPCRENVRYFVWSKPDHLSKAQSDRLRRLVARDSARPLHDVGSRIVEYKTLF
jgi:carbonic anhydrase